MNYYDEIYELWYRKYVCKIFLHVYVFNYHVSIRLILISVSNFNTKCLDLNFGFNSNFMYFFCTYDPDLSIMICSYSLRSEFSLSVSYKYVSVWFLLSESNIFMSLKTCFENCRFKRSMLLVY